jgi:hypothetical protein
MRTQTGLRVASVAVALSSALGACGPDDGGVAALGAYAAEVMADDRSPISPEEGPLPVRYISIEFAGSAREPGMCASLRDAKVRWNGRDVAVNPFAAGGWHEAGILEGPGCDRPRVGIPAEWLPEVPQDGTLEIEGDGHRVVVEIEQIFVKRELRLDTFAASKAMVTAIPVVPASATDVVATLFSPQGSSGDIIDASEAITDGRIELTFPTVPSGPRTLIVRVDYHLQLRRCEGVTRCTGFARGDLDANLERRFPVVFP